MVLWLSYPASTTYHQAAGPHEAKHLCLYLLFNCFSFLAGVGTWQEHTASTT